MRTAVLFPLCTLLALPAAARAQTPAAPVMPPPVTFKAAAPATAPAPAPRKTMRPKAPPSPALPSPEVHLTLDAPTQNGPWTLHATNAGTVPVRLAADARWLELDVTPRGERKPVRCSLPGDMRPDDDLDRSLVLPPGRTYSESFEPRLYCFGDRTARALSSQAIVVARLGWSAGSRSIARQAVSPIDGVEPVVASLPFIEAPPVSLPDEPTAIPPVVAPARADADPATLRVTSATGADAETSEGISILVSVRNDGSRPVRLRLRPETLAFDVTSPAGSETCGWPSMPGAPTRELFTTLGPHASESLSVLLADYCTRRSFDQPGLLVVRAQIDTRHAGGAEIGLKTFDGRVISTKPTLVRLHRGLGRTRLVRPQLDPGPP